MFRASVSSVSSSGTSTGAASEVCAVSSGVAAFPQDVLYTDGGVLKYIVKQYIQPLNDCFEKHECLKCGAIYEKEGTDQVANFF